MWKSLFLAVGIFLIVLGAETLVVDRFVLAEGNRVPRLVAGNSYATQNGPFMQAGYRAKKREVPTKDWMPWSMLAAGVVTVMYTCSIHGRPTAEE